MNQGCQTGLQLPPPLNFERGVEYLSILPALIFRGYYFHCLHMYACTGYFDVGGEGGVGSL